MSFDLTEGAIETIINGGQVDSPVLQIISSKAIASGATERYRLLLSDGLNSYSHAMLATQLNPMMADGEMDNLSVVKVKQYICNTLAENRRVLIVLEVEVIAKGDDVGGRLGNPQPLKPGQSSNNTAPSAPEPSKPTPSSNILANKPQGNSSSCSDNSHSNSIEKDGDNTTGGSVNVASCPVEASCDDVATSGASSEAVRVIDSVNIGPADIRKNHPVTKRHMFLDKPEDVLARKTFFVLSDYFMSNDCKWN